MDGGEEASVEGRRLGAKSVPTDGEAAGVDGRRLRTARSRARVFEAVVACSEELGFDRVEVSTIVERSGVSRRTFYRLFGGKDGVFAEPLLSERKRFEAAFREPPQPQDILGDLIERLHGLEAGRNLSLERRLWRIVHESGTLTRLYQLEIGFYEAELARWLAQVTSLKTSCDPEILAGSVMAARRVGVRRWLNGAPDDPRWPYLRDALNSLRPMFPTAR